MCEYVTTSTLMRKGRLRPQETQEPLSEYTPKGNGKTRNKELGRNKSYCVMGPEGREHVKVNRDKSHRQAEEAGAGRSEQRARRSKSNDIVLSAGSTVLSAAAFSRNCEQAALKRKLVWTPENLLSEPWFPETYTTQKNHLNEIGECISNKKPLLLN